MKSAFIEEFIKNNEWAKTFAHFYAIKATRWESVVPSKTY